MIIVYNREYDIRVESYDNEKLSSYRDQIQYPKGSKTHSLIVTLLKEWSIDSKKTALLNIKERDPVLQSLIQHVLHNSTDIQIFNTKEKIRER